MNIKGIKHIMAVAFVGVATFCLTACDNSSNILGGSLHPDNPNPQQSTQADYDGILNKIYGNLALTGLTGPHGSSDLPSDIDEGMSVFMRVVWYANELPSDESLCSWLSDGGIPEFNRGTWSDAHPLLRGIFNLLNTSSAACASSTVICLKTLLFISIVVSLSSSASISPKPFIRAISALFLTFSERVERYYWRRRKC